MSCERPDENKISYRAKYRPQGREGGGKQPPRTWARSVDSALSYANGKKPMWLGLGVESRDGASRWPRRDRAKTLRDRRRERSGKLTPVRGVCHSKAQLNITHAVAAIALIAAFPAPAVPRRLMVLGAIFSMIPDADVFGLAAGIPYESWCGHRGFSHSLLFALIAASLALWIAWADLHPPARRGLIWFYLFLATASHGLLDAATNGGLGVAFFSPFYKARYFFSFTPIAASPIGRGFFSSRGAAVIVSEMWWVWLPSIAIAIVALSFYRLRGRSALVAA